MTPFQLKNRIYNRAFNNITNIQTKGQRIYKPSIEDYNILSMGLKFIPTPSISHNFPRIELSRSYRHIVRNVKLNIQFNNKQRTDIDLSLKKPNPMYTPQNPSLVFFDKLIFPLKNNVDNLIQSKLNLKRTALDSKLYYLIKYKNLRRSTIDYLYNKNCPLLNSNLYSPIIIKPADKNLGLTIMDKLSYKDAAYKILMNQNNYFNLVYSKYSRKIYENEYKANDYSFQDFIDNLNQEYDFKQANLKDMKFSFLEDLISKLNNIVNSLQIPYYIKQFLISKTSSDKIPNFYLLPKLHKKEISYRPIVAAPSWILFPISKWLSKILMPIMRNGNTYLKNTTHLIEIIEKWNSYNITPEEQFIIITGDVISMYPSIPIDEAIQDIPKWSFKFYNNLTQSQHQNLQTKKYFNKISSEDFRKCIQLILYNNMIYFDNNYYLQKNGVAMGTPTAPQIASIFLDILESKLNSNKELIKPTIWLRYLDDILLIFSAKRNNIYNCKRKINNFLKSYGKLHKNINFTWNTSNLNIDWKNYKFNNTNTIEFLDLKIKMDDNTNKMVFKTHQKVYNKYLYIPYNSFHPKHCKKGFIHGELLRYLITNNQERNFEKIKCKFWNRLRQRGYPGKFLNPIFGRINFSQRDQYVNKAIQKNFKFTAFPNKPAILKEENIYPFKIRFNPLYANIRSSRIWQNMDFNDPTIKKFFHRKEFKLCWTNETSLNNLILRAKFNMPSLRNES